jgi:hypothetical protein
MLSGFRLLLGGVTIRSLLPLKWSLFGERFILKEHRRQIETSFSILSDVIGLNRLKVRTLSGFLLKNYGAVSALTFHITLILN